jgi:hypothetical protein
MSKCPVKLKCNSSSDIYRTKKYHVPATRILCTVSLPDNCFWGNTVKLLIFGPSSISPWWRSPGRLSGTCQVLDRSSTLPKATLIYEIPCCTLISFREFKCFWKDFDTCITINTTLTHCGVMVPSFHCCKTWWLPTLIILLMYAYCAW